MQFNRPNEVQITTETNPASRAPGSTVLVSVLDRLSHFEMFCSQLSSTHPSKRWLLLPRWRRGIALGRSSWGGVLIPLQAHLRQHILTPIRSWTARIFTSFQVSPTTFISISLGASPRSYRRAEMDLNDQDGGNLNSIYL
jgi:hypothetical protein